MKFFKYFGYFILFAGIANIYNYSIILGILITIGIAGLYFGIRSLIKKHKKEKVIIPVLDIPNNSRWEHTVDQRTKEGRIIRHFQILIESLDIISKTKNPATIKQRKEVAIQNIKQLYYNYETHPHVLKYSEFIINEFKKSINYPISDDILHIMRNPFNFVDELMFEDIFYWSKLSRCYKELYFEEMNKIKDLKTNKRKINRLEKLNDTLQVGIDELGFAGSSHPNYYDLFEIQNAITEEIESLKII